MTTHGVTFVVPDLRRRFKEEAAALARLEDDVYVPVLCAGHSAGLELSRDGLEDVGLAP